MADSWDMERTNRFAFGANWRKFLGLVDDSRIQEAEGSLRNMLEVESLEGMRFLDIGCGSGLFSLAARNLGATVVSFDYDRESVECTKYLKGKFWADDEYWTVREGDILDETEVGNQGAFDIVYSWGVLHHTGDLHTALDHASRLVRDGGRIYIAIYNDQRWLSRYWKVIKRTYNSNIAGRVLVVLAHAPYFGMRELAKRIITRAKHRPRGMDAWRDILDWLGGWPFEVARPEEILEHFKARGFILERLVTVDSRHGCNEFVFRRVGEGA